MGSTPVTWYAKRQLAAQTHTFGAEFVDLKKKATEEIILITFTSVQLGMQPFLIVQIYGSMFLLTSKLMSTIMFERDKMHIKETFSC